MQWNIIKKKETMPFAATWVDLETVILTEVKSQKYHDIVYISNLKKTSCIYTMEYYSAAKKEQNNAICSNMDGHRDYHTK